MKDDLKSSDSLVYCELGQVAAPISAGTVMIGFIAIREQRRVRDGPWTIEGEATAFLDVEMRPEGDVVIG